MANLTKTNNQFSHEIFGNLTVITNEESDVFFISNEVSKILDYSENRKMLERLDEDEKVLLSHSEAKAVLNSNDINSRGIQLLTEKGLYSSVERTYKISSVMKIEFIKWIKSYGLFKDISIYSPLEVNFLHELEQALLVFGLSFERQFFCLGYKIDAYIEKLNIAIEFDENGHKHYDKEKELQRQTEIETELKCRFIRVSDKNTNSHNIAFVIKSIYNL